MRKPVLLPFLLYVVASSAAAQNDVLLEKLTNGQDADSPPGPILLVGAPVAWTYVVTNPGGRDLLNVSVTDDQGVTVTCPATTVPAGESMICTGNGTAVEGQYANLGTVDAELIDGTPVSASDPSHYFGQAQIAVTLEKRTEGQDADLPPGPSLPVGGPVNWTYEVTNVGSDPLSGIAVADDQGVTVTCPGDTLAPGASMTCTAAGTVQPGPYVNIGSVTADLPDESVAGASDPSHHFGQVLLLEKSTNGQDADTPPGPFIPPGDPVAWTYRVTNPGPATVTGLAVADDQGVTVVCPVTTLAALESVVCTANGTAVPGQYVNIGTATAQLPLGGTVSASDPSHYFGPALALQKFTNGQDADLPPGPVVAPGAAVNWTYEVTNFGGDPFTGVTVTDDQGVTVACPGTTLTPGASMTCTANGTAIAGQYTNLGTVTALDPDLNELTATDRSHYLGLATPDVAATKTAALLVDQDNDGLADPGDTIAYTVTLINNGTGAADGVLFTDAPDPNTALVNGSVTAVPGTVSLGNTPGDTTVEVAVGSLAAGGGTATITFRVTVGLLPPGTQQIVNQGLVTGDNIASLETDDPGAPGTQDPTAVPAGAAFVTEIPTLGQWSLLTLLLLLAGLGLHRLRKAETPR